MALMHDPMFRKADNAMHVLWTRAVYHSDSYDKQQWKDLERAITDLALSEPLSKSELKSRYEPEPELKACFFSGCPKLGNPTLCDVHYEEWKRLPITKLHSQ